MHGTLGVKSQRVGGYHRTKCPPKNYWINFSLSWICTACKEIGLLHLFIFEIQSILESRDLATPIFDHAHPKSFWSTSDLYELVSACKNSGYFTNLFWKYKWLIEKSCNLISWEHFGAYLRKILPSMGFVKEQNKQIFIIAQIQ